MLVNRPTFQWCGTNDIYVLGSDGNLWLEQAPFGNVPPARQQVDGNVAAFEALTSASALVPGSDGNLWLELGPWGNVPPTRSQVDGNVKAFQAMGASGIYVLGDNGNLWLEQHPPYGQQGPRVQVDGNVADFYGMSGTEIYVLGSDGNLWLEEGPWGTVPPKRSHIDGNVADFFPSGSATDASAVVVLGDNGNLWLEYPSTSTPRVQIDGNVLAFQPYAGDDQCVVLGRNRNLWLEQSPWGTVPPKREQIDGNVQAFTQYINSTMLVLGTNGNLWVEQPPWGVVPPSRQQVDGNVAIGIPQPPPPPPAPGAPVMSNNGTTATYNSGEITVPGALPLSGYLTVLFDQQGDFTFTSHAHDAGFDGINYNIAAVILTANGMAFTFSHSGYLQGTIDAPFGTPNRDDDYTTGGFNQEIANEWANIPGSMMGWSLSGTDEIGQMLNGLLNQLLQAAGKAAATAVISLVGSAL